MLMAEMSILMPVDGMWAGDSSEAAVRRRLFGRCICLHPPLQRHGGGHHGGAQPGARSWAPHSGKVSYPYLPSLHRGTAQGLARPLCLSILSTSTCMHAQEIAIGAFSPCGRVQTNPSPCFAMWQVWALVYVAVPHPTLQLQQ